MSASRCHAGRPPQGELQCHRADQLGGPRVLLLQQLECYLAGLAGNRVDRPQVA